jgi:hypothetical protein
MHVIYSQIRTSIGRRATVLWTQITVRRGGSVIDLLDEAQNHRRGAPD